tara:strand:- start:187 stop:465 length:279 start_codon:yes stop_codon:yes gene_type:complete
MDSGKIGFTFSEGNSGWFFESKDEKGQKPKAFSVSDAILGLRFLLYFTCRMILFAVLHHSAKVMPSRNFDSEENVSVWDVICPLRFEEIHQA